MPIKLSEYRPYQNQKTNALFSTQVEADDNANPTNWVDILTATLPAAQVVAGEYEISLSWAWMIDSTSRSAYWRFVVNGVPTPFLRIESGDTNDVNAQLLRVIESFPAAADIVVTAQCVLENIGGTDTLTIEAGQLGIAIDCKANA